MCALQRTQERSVVVQTPTQTSAYLLEIHSTICPDELNVPHAHTGAPMNGNQAVVQQYNDFKWFITQLRCAAALRRNQDNKSQQNQTNCSQFPSRKQPGTARTAPAAAGSIQAAS